MSQVIDAVVNNSTYENYVKQFEWYKDNGYLKNGEVIETNLKPGDRVVIIAHHYADPRLAYGNEHTVEYVDISNAWYSGNKENKQLPKFKSPYRFGHPFKANVKLVGVNNTIKASSVKPIDGVDSMHSLPSPNHRDRTALVQEVVEETKDGKVVLTPVGSIVPFDTFEAAQEYVRKEIINTIRSKNEYRQFKVFKEVAVAVASEPPVTFK